MKKYIASILILFLAFALTPEQIKASSYNEESVFDYADLLTPEEEGSLRQITKVYEEYDMSMIFLTTSNAEGKSAMTYSDDFYDTNQFRPDGVLFLIDMDNREVYVNTVGECIKILTDYRIEKILDAGYDCVADGEYFKSFEKMSGQAGTYIENYDGSNAVESYESDDFHGSLKEGMGEAPNELSKEATQVAHSIVIAVFVTTVLSLLLVLLHRRANQRIPAGRYMGSNFHVNDKDITYMGCRKEVMHGYYRQNESSSSSSGSRSRSTVHTSSRGVSHGGGGRKF